MFVIVTVHLSPAYRTVRRVYCFLRKHLFLAVNSLQGFTLAWIQMLPQYAVPNRLGLARVVLDDELFVETAVNFGAFG